MCTLVAQSCLTLSDSMHCSPPGFFVHWILQATILQWIAIPFSRISSQPRDQTQISHIGGRFLTIWATRKAWKWLIIKMSLQEVKELRSSYTPIPCFPSPLVVGGSAGKEFVCNAGELGLILVLGRSSGEGNGNPPQYCCLENPMDRGASQVMVHRVEKSQTWLKRLSSSSSIL